MASNCVVEKKVVVSNDFKSNWVPETQEVEGVFFMKASKWDRSFVRFCAGQALQFSGGPRQDVNVSFLEVIQRLRTSAVDAAVITVPAYFDERARMATKQAGDIAGFQVLRLLAEPTAAALAYGLDQRDQGTFLVYDLGGGTFDVSLLRLTQGVFRVVGSGGHVDLGGDDLDDVLAKSFLYHTSYDAPLTPEDAARLKQEAKTTRERLSHQDFADMTLWLPNRDLSHRFSRKDFETLAAPLIDQTLRVTEDVLTEAGVAVSALDGVLLVGGTTRTPMIEVALTQRFGALPLKGIDPDHSVAVGAAYQAHALTYGSDTLLVDVTPLSLGLETMGGIVEKIIPRNTLLPASKTQTMLCRGKGNWWRIAGPWPPLP